MKKHFKLLVEGIKHLSDNPSKEEVAYMIARVAMETDIKFDGARFMKAALSQN